jgi:hypothetical protein
VHFAIDGDRFGFYLTLNFSVFTNRQNAVRVNIPFDLSVDEKFFLELNRAFDFDIAREDVFASVICHRFWDLDYQLLLVFLPLRDSRDDCCHLSISGYRGSSLTGGIGFCETNLLRIW